MFDRSLHFNVMIVKIEITRLRKIVVMTRTVLSSVSFARTAENTQCIARQSSLEYQVPRVRCIVLPWYL